MTRCRFTVSLFTALVCSLCFLLVRSSTAQNRPGNLKVRVSFSDGRPCNIKVRVQLMLSGSGSPVAENYSNDSGQTDFDDVQVGNYHLIVSGEGIEQTDSGIFEVDSRRGVQFQNVTVRRTDEAKANVGGPSTVAAQDMNIPKAAAKQFNKASDLIAREQWKEAIDRLNKALAIYPQYVQAYNNMGVVYARMGDRASELAALQKAVSLNQLFAPAWVNLARMSIVDRDFPTAETLLEKAVALEPTNSETLLILANVQLMNLRYDKAIATSKKVHSLGQDSHALVHFIAARAFEHESRFADAKDELRTFLKEEPDGVRAQAARKELAALQEQLSR